ncbi:hypothetical protein NQ315_010074 [Exocentrus adspersus]|uniref:Chromo domain-containing protein n=1 Tax=Exocentrus adspersus TaxID=1586481 RepID=A0AAV8WB77_9CUCU|nr:hypothetical protein NQ315_010074 [Exocentrus adspersus]
MLSIGPKMDGGPNIKYFEASETLAALEGVKQWLQKNGKKYVQNEPLTNKSLAATTVQLMQFQEDFFGIPVKCFLDFKPGGGLCHILLAAYRFKSEHGWRRFELPSGKNASSKLERVFEMYQNMEKALIGMKMYTLPIVYIRPDIDKAVVIKLKDIIRRRGGQVVDSEESASHIIYGSVDPLKEEYGRPVIKKR